MMRRNETLPSELLRPANVIELPVEACPELALSALQSVITAFQVFPSLSQASSQLLVGRLSTKITKELSILISLFSSILSILFTQVIFILLPRHSLKNLSRKSFSVCRQSNSPLPPRSHLSRSSCHMNNT
jgi:hypothetical protein